MRKKQNMNDIQIIVNILISFLGEPKNEIDDSLQLQFPCPRCIEENGLNEASKYNLEVNLRKQVFNCWKCSSEHDEMHGTIIKLIKLYGNHKILKEYREAIKNFQESEYFKLKYNINDFNLNTHIALNKEIQLPPTFHFFKENDSFPKEGLEYLFKRNISWDIIKKYNLGFTSIVKDNFLLSNRIIIPSFNEFGELNYWTGRYFGENKKVQKYFNLSIERKNIIFNEEKINWNADITLVEGPFDHLVVPNSIPLLSKKLKSDFLLYQKLLTKANANINIFLDGDAIHDAHILYEFLNHDKLYNRLRIVPTIDNLDPSEIYQKYGKKGIMRCLSNTYKLKNYFLIS